MAFQAYCTFEGPKGACGISRNMCHFQEHVAVSMPHDHDVAVNSFLFFGGIHARNHHFQSFGRVCDVTPLHPYMPISRLIRKFFSLISKAFAGLLLIPRASFSPLFRLIGFSSIGRFDFRC